MLVALAHSTVPLTHQRNLSEWAQVTLLQGSLIPAGWISRKHLPSGRGRSFFLTSLLIELIDPTRREQIAQSCDNACYGLCVFLAPFVFNSLLVVGTPCQ